MIALGSNKGKACGIFARFRRVDIPVCRKKTGTDKYTMVMPGA